MPCFNVANTITRALDSILMQKTDFPYEIIIIDDASTDESASLFIQYRKKYDQIKLITHRENSGNAKSFYDGLSASQGCYFCVLDGDDYYTIRNKLQLQIDFFRSDEKEEYVACAHYHVFDLGNGRVNLPATYPFSEFTYSDFLTQNAGYFHTSTYMYRNIFRGNIPEYFKESLYRGDTPRTTFHLMYSNKKIKILNFVGSAYSFDNNGIWSSLSEKKQFEYQVNYLEQHKNRVATEFERKSIDRLIFYNKKRSGSSSENLRKYESIDIDTALCRLRSYASQFAYKEKDFMMTGLYNSEYIDTACASLGYVYLVWNHDLRQDQAIEKHIAIVIGELRPHGGGIFREIIDIIEMYLNSSIYIFVTNMQLIPDETRALLSKYQNVHIVGPEHSENCLLEYYFSEIKKCSPNKMYVYTSHNDVYAQAIMQSSYSKNICIFSFDHGFICGLCNPNYDCYIAKRSVDYTLLSKKFGDSVIFIPTWNRDNFSEYEGLAYKPYNNHTSLITSCAAARFYKVDGKQPYSYIDFVIALLIKTKGVHYHFGKIPDAKFTEIREKLKSNNIPESSFINIPWANDLGKELLTNHVDVFLEPFPVVSYKITLAVMSCGIPILAYNGIRRMEIADFLYPHPFSWNNQEDFISKLADATKEELTKHSLRAREYYSENHSTQVLAPFFMTETAFKTPPPVYASDLLICDIRSYTRIWGDCRVLNIMKSATIKTQPIKNQACNEADIQKTAPRAKFKENLKRWDSILRTTRDTSRILLKTKCFYHLVMLLSPYTVYKKAKVIIKMTSGFFAHKSISHKSLGVKVHECLQKLYAIKATQTECAAQLTEIKLLSEEMILQSKQMSEAMSAQSETLRLNQTEQKRSGESLYSKVIQGNKLQQEILWGNIYNNTTAASEWYQIASSSPGRWAAGYPFLYVLYQVLSCFKPLSILDLGIGETTKMVMQYVAKDDNCNHIAIEEDRDWIMHFKQNNTISPQTKIIQLDYDYKSYLDEPQVRILRQFREAVSGETFDLIIIDAPIGSKGKYSRIDILSIIPDCLEKRFVILFDDCDRDAEKATLGKLEDALTDYGILYAKGNYQGLKNTVILTSPDAKFLCTL